jgi:uridine phosphorylase
MNNFLPSELILNEDSSVYHLKLLPTDIADFIIVVGDPNRVPMVSNYFDSIEIKKNNREFVTHTGTLGEKQISVLSTGMGVSNIDIVFNELDILSSIDLTEATLKKERRQFKIIRLGTTGSLSKDIPLNALLFSKYAIGVDGIPLHYNFDETLFENDLARVFTSKTNWPNELALPYAVESSPELFKQLYEPQFYVGITLTMNGFYAPQGRQLRIPIKNPNIKKGYENVSYKNYNLTNLEMETAGLYAFGKIFNHQVLSISTVLANRVTGKFSQNPEKTVDCMIQTILTKIRALK